MAELILSYNSVGTAPGSELGVVQRGKWAEASMPPVRDASSRSLNLFAKLIDFVQPFRVFPAGPSSIIASILSSSLGTRSLLIHACHHELNLTFSYDYTEYRNASREAGC